MEPFSLIDENIFMYLCFIVNEFETNGWHLNGILNTVCGILRHTVYALGDCMQGFCDVITVILSRFTLAAIFKESFYHIWWSPSK